MNTEELQKICRTLNGVTEDIKWGNDLVFSVAEKMFFVVGLDQVPVSASFKVSDEEFEELSVKEGFIPAPYMARNKWVLVKDIRLLSSNQWQTYIEQSYKLVASKLPLKTRKQLGLI